MKFCWILVVVVLGSCHHQKKRQLPAFKFSREILAEAPSFQNFLNLPEFVVLETRDTCMLSGNPFFSISEEYIWALDLLAGKVLAFSRKDGKFLRQIGNRGRGPEEYGSIEADFYNLPDDKIFCQDVQGRLMEYDISGKLQRKISLPFYDDSFRSPSLPTSFILVNDSVFCTFYSNINGLEKKRLVLFSPEGKIHGVFPNPCIIHNVKGFYAFGKDGLFYNWKGKTYFKESKNDTIFQVTPDSLIPHFCIDQGEYSVSYADHYKERIKPGISQQSLWENDRYIYFLFTFRGKPRQAGEVLYGDYLAVYPKETGVQRVYKIDALQEAAGEMDISKGFRRPSLKMKCVGFYEGNLITSLSPLAVREYFGHTESVEEWKNIKEEDNPVLLFWHLP